MPINAYYEYHHILFSIIHGPVEVVTSHILECSRESLRRRAMVHDPFTRSDGLLNPERYHLVECDVDLSWAYLLRPTPGFQPFQELYWEPRSNPGTTAMMSNMYEGGYLDRSLPWDWVRVVIRDREPHVDPSFHFAYYANGGAVRRELCVARDDDDNWRFLSDGPVQRFEKPDYYERRRIVERLNRDIITEYLAALGYTVTEEAFWASDKRAWLMWDDFGGRKEAPSKHCRTE